jgi:hypothetical protein
VLSKKQFKLWNVWVRYFIHSAIDLFAVTFSSFDLSACKSASKVGADGVGASQVHMRSLNVEVDRQSEPGGRSPTAVIVVQSSEGMKAILSIICQRVNPLEFGQRTRTENLT